MTTSRTSRPTGIGLRSAHHQDVIAQRPAVGFLEVHSENFFHTNNRKVLDELTPDYPFSFHGVGLSLGSAEGIDPDHLAKLKNLVDTYEPWLVSDHVSWSHNGTQHVPDLLPLPYTEEALQVVCDNIDHVQQTLGRQMLVENPSAYLVFAQNSMSEPEFLQQIVDRTNCGLLLDINNIHVSAHNQQFDAREYLAQIPATAVQEMHLAGYHVNTLSDGQEVWIDTHSKPVYPAVWELYRDALKLLGDVTTLIEWDTDLPALDVLLAEATKADKTRAEVNPEQRHAA